MKKIFLHVLPLGLAFMLSCEHKDYFEEKSPEQYPFVDMDTYEEACYTAYNLALWNGYGGFPFNEIAINTCYSSESKWIDGHHEDLPQREVHLRDFSFEISHISSRFNHMYNLIGNCNGALDLFYTEGFAPERPFESMDSTDILNANRIAGEMHFLRAYAYFHLAHRFCPDYTP
ncbi:MAG: hypothetical protein HC896_18430, partial [Bacteroidales bacterium]|nr:hypothetical protein [Bacteroidales bacterium]